MTKPYYRRGLFWAILFALLFLLSQSNLLIDYSQSPGLLGFPNWLWIYILIHGLLLLALYGFIKWYWSKEKSEES